MDIPKEAQGVLMQLQMSQQQLEQISMQKQQFAYKRIELDQALAELLKVGDEDVFKNLGPVLIKTTKEEMQKELKESLDKIDETLTKMDESEKKITEGAERAQKKLQEMMEQEKKTKK